MPSSQQGPRWHPAAYHCLDVAASATVLLEQDNRLRRSLTSLAGLSEAQVRSWIPFIMALHDLGKFSFPFQCQVPDLAHELLGWTSSQTCSLRHDTIGYLFFADLLRQGVVTWLCSDSRIAVTRNGQPCSTPRRLLEALSPWMKASCGHHGRPPAGAAFEGWFYPDQAREAARSWVDALLDLMRPGPLHATSEAMARSSWLIAGLAVLADWVGSNQQFFPYEPPTHSLPDYWALAQQRAHLAVKACGLLPATPAPLRSPSQLLPRLTDLTPLQQRVSELPLASGPQLWILEDVTGSGKTEAALLLAHRLMAAGHADGLYFALPTMATANGMFRRVEDVFENFFLDRPSLTLAHGKTTLFHALQQPARDVDPDGLLSASHHSAAWLADNRKKSLLASLGVGTVDQALLGVLPSKHSPLRVLGLHRKVLIVDEVHACDVYMAGLLERLLEFHASLGGSAILLSATLPRGFRQELVRAFLPAAATEGLQKNAYPLVTLASQGVVQEHECAAAERSRRDVAVRFVHTVDEVLTLLHDTLAAGRCAVWIRNSVDDAIEARDLLGDHADVHLFHARFVMGDRQRIEDENLARFGRTSDPAARRGQILIATQVVEQSLDLDFDVMISDLAPMELLLQRAGRLHRHARALDGTLLGQGPDQRPPPVLHVLAPPFEDEPSANWLSGSVLRRTSRVYENHAMLWSTQRTLLQRGALRTPLESRALIEDACAPAPAGLEAQENKVIGKELTRASVATSSALPFAQGYQRDDQRWLDDTRTPTRLSDETTTVRLVRLVHGRPVPFFDHPERHLAWQLSEVTVRTSRLAAPLEDDTLAAARKEMSDEGKWCVPVVMVQEQNGVWGGKALDSRGNTKRVIYDPETGVVLQ